jgi:hypothetical protein
MTQRLIRVFLALAVAFVFTGRMEAAAQHCARLIAAGSAAQQADLAVDADATPCHGMDEAQPAKAHHPAPHKPITDKCECVAVLKACTPIVEAAASTRIEPYAWAKPEAVAFVSVEPAPDLRPPRA